MSEGAFRPDDVRLLAPAIFRFVLDSELKRAVRAQTFLTLVVLEATREWDELHVAADDGTVEEVGQVVGREIRGTDLVSKTATGTLSVALLEADLEQSRSVVDRVVGRLETYEFATPVSFEVGAACYPTHAMDAESLHREALARPVRRSAARRARPPRPIRR